jgi:protein-S-isoprenylcysteine O-methyltransferase Ste14
MFPVLVFMYWRLSMTEEREAFAAFGEKYAAYKRVTPAFFPRLSRSRHGQDALLPRS